MANAQVILREKIEGLGAEADVVKVRAGFARNFLIPQGKAYEATRSNLRHVENLKASRAKREAVELEEAQALAAKVSKLRPKFTLDVGQGGKAFGSVTAHDILKEIEAAGITLPKHAVELEKAIKTSGKHDVTVNVHPGVSTTLTVNVTATGEAAEG